MHNSIPTSKHDLATTEKLHQYSIGELRPIIPALLEWMQDGNWPVFVPVRDYLKKYVAEIQDEILAIFRTDDDVWKYWILLSFGEKITDPRLIEEIKRMMQQPTVSEKEEGLEEIAQELVGKMSW